jgi:hypothetical protein
MEFSVAWHLELIEVDEHDEQLEIQTEDELLALCYMRISRGMLVW